MKYCPKCHVSIDAPRHYCPLCGGVLTGGDGEEKELFPVIPPLYKQYSLFFRVMIYLSIFAGVSAVSINLMLPQSGWWSVMVILAECGIWIAIATGLRRRTSFSKRILWQSAVILMLLTAADALTGWHRWSVNYVIPLTLMFTILAILLVEFIMSHRVQDYAIYLFVCGGMGFLPLVLVFTGVATVRWPALLSMAVSVLTISALFLFGGHSALEELKRRLHM